MIRRAPGPASVAFSLLLLLAAGAYSVPVRAQTPGDHDEADDVALRDGTHLRGRVVRSEPGRVVVIDTTDGRRHTLSWEAVTDVSVAPRSGARAPAARAPPTDARGRATEPPSTTQTLRSGATLSYELRGEIVGIVLPTHDYALTGTCGTGNGTAPVSMYGASANGNGHALGIAAGARAAYVQSWRPRPETGSSWWAVHAGGGADFGYAYATVPTGLPTVSGQLCSDVQRQSYDLQYTTSRLMFAEVLLSIGAQLGVGAYADGQTWRGIVVGFSWAPAVTFVKPSVGEGSDGLNYLGAEVTVDFATLRPIKNKQAQPRIALFVLPPTAATHPAIATLSFGAVWY